MGRRFYWPRSLRQASAQPGRAAKAASDGHQQPRPDLRRRHHHLRDARGRVWAEPLYAGWNTPTPPSFDRFLAYVPVAAFAALIAPDVAHGPGALAPRLLGVLAAAVAVWRLEKLWAGLLLGMAAFWAAQFLLLGGM